MSKRSASKVTSPKVARKASKLLRNGRTSVRVRSVAASALAQARGAASAASRSRRRSRAQPCLSQRAKTRQLRSVS